MSGRRVIIPFVLVALAPGAAAAQFTTFVPPPRPVDTVIVTDTLVAAVPSADSVARANIENMKAWVDSAAGNAVDLRGELPPVTTPVDDGDVFVDGAPAPNTATPLPLIVALGAGAMGMGAFLLRRR